MKSGITALVFLCFLMAGINTARTQTVLTTDILDPIWETPDTILAIDGPNITLGAEASATIISEIYSKLPDSSLMADFNIRMENIKAALDTIEGEFLEFDEGDFKTKTVLYFKNELLLIDAEKESLKELLAQVSHTLISSWDKIEYLRQTWEVSLAYVHSEDLTSSLANRSAQMLEESTTLTNYIVEMEDIIIHYSDDLLNEKKRIDKLTSRVEVLELNYEMIYLSKTHPAIWERDTLPPDTTIKLKYVIAEVSDTYSEGLTNFYAQYKIRLWINFFIFLFFLGVSLFVRRNIRKGLISSDDRRIQVFFKIFSRPVSISLTLALFLFIILYPNAPSVAGDLASYVIIFPLVLVSLLILPKRWHTLIIAGAVLFIFEEVLETLRFDSLPLPRYLLLVVVILTTAFVAWLIIKQKAHSKNIGRKRVGLPEIGLWLSICILLAAIITNFTGYVAMSFFLFRGLVISVMAGILIKVTVSILDSFLTLMIMGKSSQMLEMVREHGNNLVDRVISLVKFFAVIYWITIVLRRFMIYDPVLDWLMGILNTKWVVNDLTISVESILYFGLIIFLSFWISRLIRLILNKEVYPRVKFSRGIPGIISLIIRVAIITIGFILSLSVLGIKMDKLTILLGALGVGIGFGLQDIINNLISGFILVFERPIQVGDIVKFGEREGKVKEIGIRASTIKTYDGTEVIVPNGKLVSQELINLTLSDRMLRVEIDISTDYGSDPQEVIDILVMQAKLHPGILKNPEAFAIFFGFGDYALKFRLYTYTNEVDSRLRIRSELNLAISQAFKEAGIKIPYPKQDISVKMDEE